MGVNNPGINIFAGVPAPGVLKVTGRVFYVGNSSTYVPGGVAGTDDTAQGDTPQKPFATLNYAIKQCVAGRGDVIYGLPGHAETIAAADGALFNVAGVSFYGLGEGAARPTFTFSAVASSIRVTAANTTIKNIIGTPSINAVTNPFHIQAADCALDIEWRDSSATVEALRAVLTTAAADRLTCKVRYIGFTAGTSVVNAVRLVGCDQGRIEIDVYGICTTAWVEFVTTACKDVNVTGYTYTSGITNGSRNVVDTITGSTWWSDIIDGSAGSRYTGGSAVSVASDDISTIASNILVPTADVTTNTAARDVVGNKTDAAVTTVGTTKTIIAYVKGLLNQLGTLVNTGGTATVGDILGDPKNLALSLRVPMRTAFAKADVTAVTAWTTANSPVTIATVTGVVLCRVMGHVTTAITSTGATGTLALGVSSNTTLWIAATTANGTNFGTNDVWVGPTTTSKGNLLNNTSGWALVSNDTIKVTIATNNMTAGGMTLYVEWYPISSGATVA